MHSDRLEEVENHQRNEHMQEEVYGDDEHAIDGIFSLPDSLSG